MFRKYWYIWVALGIIIIVLCILWYRKSNCETNSVEGTVCSFWTGRAITVENESEPQIEQQESEVDTETLNVDTDNSEIKTEIEPRETVAQRLASTGPKLRTYPYRHANKRTHFLNFDITGNNAVIQNKPFHQYLKEDEPLRITFSSSVYGSLLGDGTISKEKREGDIQLVNMYPKDIENGQHPILYYNPCKIPKLARLCGE